MENKNPILWDLYDARDHRRVGTHPKGLPVPQGFYHIAVEVIVTDFNGHLLVLRRALTKKRAPGMWEFPGGSVLAGENPSVAVKRVLKQKTGLQASKVQLLQKAFTSGLLRLIYYAHVPELLSETIVIDESDTCDHAVITPRRWFYMLTNSLYTHSHSRFYRKPVFEFIDNMID